MHVMPIRDIWSAYLDYAMAQPVYDKLQDGTFVGRIPSCTGIVACGATCQLALSILLDQPHFEERADVIMNATDIALDDPSELTHPFGGVLGRKGLRKPEQPYLCGNTN